jgi:hypothetical protein
MKILLISGAPASGKDTAVHAINGCRPVLKEKFALPLRRALCGLLGVHDDALEWMKRDDPRVRQMMIWLSEEVVKPLYGDAWFGFACARRVENEWARTDGDVDVVVTDAGFDDEIKAFCKSIREFEPEARFQLWRLTRPFCTYDDDSRGKVTLPAEYGEVKEIHNLHGLQDFKKQVVTAAEEFFNG